MRIMLTGGSGLIGQHLVKALLADGHDVLCAQRHRPAIAHPRLQHLHADFTQDSDKGVWLARLRDVELVINAVGIFRERPPQTFAALHTATPCALFAACVEAPSVHLVIQLSALGADEGATTRYHQSKKAADDFLAALPIQSFIVQPSLVYASEGTSARFFKAIASMPVCARLGSAAQSVQPIHIDDVVAALMALLHEPSIPKLVAGAARRIALVGPQALPFIDYLAALRHGLGMGPLRVIRLPDWAAHLAAHLGMGLFDPDTLRMLERGNNADPAPTAKLLGRPARSPESFITCPMAERAQAKLSWLLPVLRWSIALVWLVTALVSARYYPAQASYALLERTGAPAHLAPLLLAGAVACDLLLGLGIILRVGGRALWLAQIALIGFYSVVIAWKLPEFLVHPYGPLVKNLPMLAAIWLLYAFEEEK